MALYDPKCAESRSEEAVAVAAKNVAGGFMRARAFDDMWTAAERPLLYALCAPGTLRSWLRWSTLSGCVERIRHRGSIPRQSTEDAIDPIN
ncbi:unnamed protein product [Leptosia nina]|uniref:Uncharacterized protein n=1 Tax=Leptosia nina TaxID=320188 RepID=A0AAV1J1R3_9NEOP